MKTFLYGAVFVGAASATAVDVRTSASGVMTFLSHERGWKDVVYVTETLSPSAYDVYRVYTSASACGRGLCPQYIFGQTAVDGWRLIGYVGGRLRVDPTQVSNGLYDLIVTSSVGNTGAEVNVTRFRFDGRRYVALP